MTQEEFTQVESDQKQHHEILEHQVRIGSEVLKESILEILEDK